MSRTKMKKFIGSIGSIKRSSRSRDREQNGSTAEPRQLPQGDAPEAVVVREVTAFCESGAPGSVSAGDEYLHLPAIVDAAESSPAAAKEAASSIRQYLSKENFSRGYAQYNAIMLTRILTDNPGKAFTQYFDKNFISTVKELLRQCQDASVQQIMRESLDYFEAEKVGPNQSLVPLVEMWRKEKGRVAGIQSPRVRLDPGDTDAVEPNIAQGPYSRFSHQQAPPVPQRGLPPPAVLAEQIEQARTSARLLVQMIQSTPAADLQSSDLIKEFVDRCKQAHKSMERYMASENPAPDENTMLTMIETNEQLNIAMTKHQRAMLNARKTSAPPARQQQDPFAMLNMSNTLPQTGHQQQVPPEDSGYYQQSQQAGHYQQPQQPAQPQRSAGYNQPYVANGGANRDSYKATSTVSPLTAHEQHTFTPPPGPPPRKQATSSPPRTEESMTSPVSPTISHGYSTQAESNPFTDDAYGAPEDEPTKRDSAPHEIFNRAAGQLRQSPNVNQERPSTVDLDAASYPVPPPHTDRSPTDRPGLHGYNSGWEPTPSFVHRQESSTGHLTMHGASPTRG